MKRYRANDVTHPTRPGYAGKGNQQQRGAVSPGTIEPNATIPEPQAMPPIEPAKVVSGASPGPIKSRPSNTPGAPRTFQLPDRVSPAELLAQSRRYGGSR